VIQSYYNKRIVGCPGGEGGTVLLMLKYPKRLPEFKSSPVSYQDKKYSFFWKSI
jgi:hypothetical protein